MTRSRAFSGFQARSSGARPLATLAGVLALSAAAATLAGPGHRGPEFPLSVAEAKDRAEARFQELDADRSGEVSPEELAAAPHPRFGHGFRGHHGKRHEGSPHDRHDKPAGAERQAWRERRAEKHQAMQGEVFTHLDQDGDGQISREEFDTESMREARHQARLERVFARLDDDGSGGLSREELPDMSRHLAAMDTDSDGTVTREEARAHHQARKDARRAARSAEQS